ncbi:MAG: chromosome segregation protein SMC, partial [Acidobacteriota bacterium]|nr:chromosome segregation protein SMC [Acidobacteriota bacterium]
VHLSTTWSRWNTLILDDPMQHVDDFRALHLAEVLGSIRRSGRQILCAVEDRSLADLLARRLATSESQSGSVLELKYELGEGSTIASIDTVKPLKPRLFTAA